jgi:hypothetical protein
MKNRVTTNTATTIGAVILSLFFLGLTIPHSADVLSNFEKRDSMLPWLFAVGLEVLVAFAMYIVCEVSFRSWVRFTAGGLVAVAIVSSIILNFAHYMAVNGNTLYSLGLAALLPGLVAGLGAMLPGLMDETQQVEMVAPPPTSIDPMPILQEALAAMKRQLEESSNRAIEMISAQLPELVRNELATARYFTPISEMGLAISEMPDEISETIASRGETISEMETNPKEIARKLKAGGATIAEIAKAVGKSERMVQNYLKE